MSEDARAENTANSEVGGISCIMVGGLGAGAPISNCRLSK
jgi:hypothetical protein